MAGNCKNPLCNAPLLEARKTKPKDYCDPSCGYIWRALKLVAPELVKVGTETAARILVEMAK